MIIRWMCVVAAVVGLSAGRAEARGGGGCLIKGTPVLTSRGEAPVQEVRCGDMVVGADGPARVMAVMPVRAEEFVKLTFASGTLEVTPEHPVMVARGVFRKAEMLAAEDVVWTLKEGRSEPTKLLAVSRERISEEAFNLLVTPGGTFVAGGLVVHNKGCFLPDTPILRADGSSVAIGRVRPGEKLLAFDADGNVVKSTVRSVLTASEPGYVILTTETTALRVTPEHPFYVGNGTYKTPEALSPGDTVFAFDGKGLSSQKVLSIERVEQQVIVYNLQTDTPNTFFAAGIAVHNKGGGCFPAGTLIRTPEGARAIESLGVGETVLAVKGDGGATPVRVESVFAAVAPICVVETKAGILRTTAEHPLCLAGGGVRPAGEIAPGDSILVCPGDAAEPTTVLSVRSSSELKTVFNLSVGPPHTFIADGFAVHNKGGGCFPAGTLILTREGARTIESLGVGESVLAVKEDGAGAFVKVESVFAAIDRICTVETEAGALRTTAEHPLCLAGGGFRPAGELAPGDAILAWRGDAAQPARVISVRTSSEMETVFNLSVGAPHTFVADGFVVHNKGGGFGGGGFSGGGFHGSGGSGGDIDPDMAIAFLVIIGIFVLVFVIGKVIAARNHENVNLDYVYRASAVAGKAAKTLTLLQFIAKTDPDFAPETLEGVAEKTFLKLQECWQAREYGPMEGLMMTDLYQDHLGQIAAMKRSHEIDMIGDLGVEKVEVVNVRYTHDPETREFTALITAHARDYYIDDQTRAFRRGDLKTEQFQEFWTFQMQGKTWLLRDIEQTRESEKLAEENFFEPMTKDGLQQVYGEAASGKGEAGPWLEGKVQTKAAQISSMLSFLAQTDKIWDREQMLDRVREVFVRLHVTLQAGDPEGLPVQDLFPDMAEHLRKRLETWRAQGHSVEFRNLCVRKVELLLVRNFEDKTKDEFTARVSAHAQRVFTTNGAEVLEDEDVAPFTEFWTFGRLDEKWKLKEVLPPDKGSRVVGQENLDEDSTPDQLQWYYRQERAV